MKKTLNYTGRKDLNQDHIELTREIENNGIVFKILELSNIIKSHNFEKDDNVFIFAQDRLCVETINVGTIGDLLKSDKSQLYSINDNSILTSNDLSLDIHIISQNGEIKSRTDKIRLGKGNKPQSSGTSGSNIPFDIDTKDIGKKI